ncbi:MAG: hypothetical protein P9M00_01160 [Candidatus Tritonobacter lacicola]|nr:hypothetical protein [Candidatus Tritonobacter lacicola]
MRDIEYLKHNVRDSIVNDVIRVARYHSRHYSGKQAGFFGIPRQVFCYIDYLGLIAFGDNSNTKRAVKFIKKYFPLNYHDYAELLYSMWRHGTVHEYEPKSYCAYFPSEMSERISVKWLSNNNNARAFRDENMRFYSMQGNISNIYLVINICQLADDLLAALDALILEIRNGRVYRCACENRLSRLGDVRKYIEVRGVNSRNAVKNQIFLAFQKRAGEIDQNGRVVNRFAK